jgi:flagellar basal body-associated protein FliL
MQEQEQPKPRGIIPPFIGSLGRGLQKGLRSIGIVLAAVLILMMVCINLWIAYIMFAPDTMPKPFYLTYQTVPGQANQTAEKSSTTAQQPAEQSQQAAAAPAIAPKAPSVPLEIKAGQGIMFDTGTKIVNLADPSGRRYIKTNIILEYAPNDITYFLESKEDTSGATGGAQKTEGGNVPVMKYADRFKQELEPLSIKCILRAGRNSCVKKLWRCSTAECRNIGSSSFISPNLPCSDQLCIVEWW